MSEKKRGALSLKEEDFITQQCQKMTVEEIAKSLNRGVAPIKKFIEKNHLISKNMSIDEENNALYRARLRARDYYGKLKMKFTLDELKYFESQWINLVKQFETTAEVLYSEEMQIVDLITQNIIGDRSMNEYMSHMKDIQNLQDLLEAEYAVSPDNRDKDRIAALQSQLDFSRSAVKSYTSERTKILEKTMALTKELKAGRNDRIKRIEDSKTTFATYIDMLQDLKRRQKEGEEINLMRLAIEKTRSTLSEDHVYEDKKIDRPLLTPETVDGYDFDMENIE